MSCSSRGRERQREKEKDRDKERERECVRVTLRETHIKTERHTGTHR